MNNLNYQMLRIRRIEEALADRYSELKIRTPIHLSIGEESVAVGVISNLQPHDKVFGGHRSHAQYLAAGSDLNAMVAELYGKSTGCSNGGRGGSMHLSSDGMFVVSTSIVGGTIPLAVGCSWAAKLKKEPSVTVVFFGDGAVEEGITSESFSFASLHNLPIVFVVADNGLAVTTKASERKSPRFSLAVVADGYGLAYSGCDGWDLESVSHLSKNAIDRAREGIPQILHFKTERQRVHCGVEHEFELLHDTVKPGTPEEELMLRNEIEAAFKFAEESAAPIEAWKGVYAE